MQNFEKQNGCHSQLFENHKDVLNLEIWQLVASNLHNKYILLFASKASLIVMSGLSGAFDFRQFLKKMSTLYFKTVRISAFFRITFSGTS